MLDKLTDKAIALIRTVVPGLWGALVGHIFTWLVLRGVLDSVWVAWQGPVTVATTTIVTGLCIMAVYQFARWVEARSNWLSRFIASVLLVIFKAPTYVK